MTSNGFFITLTNSTIILLRSCSGIEWVHPTFLLRINEVESNLLWLDNFLANLKAILFPQIPPSTEPITTHGWQLQVDADIDDNTRQS